MQLTLTQEAQALVVRPDMDHLDASRAPAFSQAMAPLLQTHACVVLDMSRLAFLDSAGLGALIECQRTAQQQQVDFRLFGLQRPVQTLFDLMRMHRILAVFPDKDRALHGHLT